MKVKPIAIKKLQTQLAKKAAASALSYTEIGNLAGVHPSQASRICRRDFVTLSQNVVQVCRVLEIDIDALIDPPHIKPIRKRLMAELFDVWDGTPEDARRIKRLLAQLKDFRDDSIRQATKAAMAAMEVKASDGPPIEHGP